jgi:hypothetical protein
MNLKKFKEEINYDPHPKWKICSRCVHFSMDRMYGVDTNIRCCLGKPFKVGKSATCDRWELNYVGAMAGNV